MTSAIWATTTKPAERTNQLKISNRSRQPDLDCFLACCIIALEFELTACRNQSGVALAQATAVRVLKECTTRNSDLTISEEEFADLTPEIALTALSRTNAHFATRR